MNKKIINTFIAALVSFILTFTGYTYLLQTPTFLSRSRLVLALLIWLGLFALFSLVLKRFPVDILRKRQNLLGVAGIFILINLIFAGFLFHTPYTYLLLPTQTIRVRPLIGEKTIHLTSFNTELVEGISLSNFANSTGWKETPQAISFTGEQISDLDWQGRPGEYVELEFLTCPECGKVKIAWNSRESQELDLAVDSPLNRITVRHDFPSLKSHQLANVLLLELSILLVALILFWAGIAGFRRIQGPEPGPPKEATSPNKYLPFLGLAGLTFCVYGLMIRPILFNDDWCQIYTLNFEKLGAFMAYERRPLHWILPWALNQVLSLQNTVYAMYVVQVCFLFIGAALLFILIKLLSEGEEWFAFLVAGFWLVFPSDYTRLYITVLGIRFSFVLLLLMMIVFVQFMKAGRPWRIILIIALLILSLLMYEGELGLAIVWPILMLIAFRRNLNRDKIIGIVGYYVVMALFVVWKLLIQPQVAYDSKLASLTLNPLEIFFRYLNTWRSIFGGFRLPFPGTGWLTIQNAGLIGAISLSVIGFYWIATRTINQRELPSDIRNTLKRNSILLITGIVLFLAGYFPIILNYPPNIYGHLSRVNLFGIPGAILIVITMIYSILLILSQRQGLAANLTVAAVLPMILFAAIVQVQTQQAYRQSWQEARAFYQELFRQVPDLKSGAQIALVLNGYEDTGAVFRPLFSSGWEAECAIRTLYDRDEIAVAYRYPQLIVPPFPAFGVLNSTLETDTIGETTDAGNLLILDYDRQAHRLSIRESAAGLRWVRNPEAYAPRDQILSEDRLIVNRRLLD